MANGERVQALKDQFHKFVWQSDTQTMPGYKRQVILFLKICSLVIRDLAGGMLSLRAMSLVYITLLSLVPLIAVSFSLLKGFGVHNQVAPMLANLLLALGDKGPEISKQIISFVDNMKMGVLGSVGLAMLMLTVIALISKIESAFNYTWRISSAHGSVQRFSNYLSIIMVGPVMVFTAIGLTASLGSNTVVAALKDYAFVGHLMQFVAYLLPFVFIIAAFTFVYLLVPNTKVIFKSALYGAFFSGIAWEVLGRAFASFASGSTSYTAIYSGFAILILFMIWLYLAWLLLLTGANIAYYHQHPERLKWDNQRLTLTGQLQEQSMLQIMFFIAKSHALKDSRKITLNYLTEQLNIGDESVLFLIEILMHDGFVKSSEDDPKQYFPAQSIELIKVADIINCARQDCGASSVGVAPVIVQLMQQHKEALSRCFMNSNFATLINAPIQHK